MAQDPSRRPAADEHLPYYERYVRLVPDGDVLETLAAQALETRALLSAIDPARAGHRYAPGKWSVRELVGHVLDSERVFSYRALTFARNADVELPGFDEGEFARVAGHDGVALADLVDDFGAVRAASLSLFRRLDPAAWDRQGLANGARISVRALAWVLAGHERHHVAVLRERYLA